MGHKPSQPQEGKRDDGGCGQKTIRKEAIQERRRQKRSHRVLHKCECVCLCKLVCQSSS